MRALFEPSYALSLRNLGPFPTLREFRPMSPLPILHYNREAPQSQWYGNSCSHWLHSGQMGEEEAFRHTNQRMGMASGNLFLASFRANFKFSVLYVVLDKSGPLILRFY